MSQPQVRTDVEDPGLGSWVDQAGDADGAALVRVREITEPVFTHPSVPALRMASGLIPLHRHVEKFGRSTNVDNGITTDIWDRANASNDQDIWVAPTVPRVHNLASTSASDALGGVGANTVFVYGLASWGSDEVSELVIMNGTSNVATKRAYVIIYRMEVKQKGATSMNVGVITATAVSDATVTAQINATFGQTQMAIYGVPSTHTAFMVQLYASFNKSAGATGAIDVSLVVNTTPDQELTNFTTKHTSGGITTGTSHFAHTFPTFKRINGPAILKMQAVGSANDLDVSAGFDLMVVHKSMVKEE